jgi:hypothetical protein
LGGDRGGIKNNQKEEIKMETRIGKQKPLNKSSQKAGDLKPARNLKKRTGRLKLKEKRKWI